MTSTIEKADQQLSAKALENVLISGDLSKLSPADRMGYYQAVCNSLGLNPLTKPFDYITLNGKRHTPSIAPPVNHKTIAHGPKG